MSYLSGFREKHRALTKQRRPGEIVPSYRAQFLSGHTDVFALNLRPPPLIDEMNVQGLRVKTDAPEKRKRKARAVIPKEAFYVDLNKVKAEQAKRRQRKANQLNRDSLRSKQDLRRTNSKLEASLNSCLNATLKPSILYIISL